LFHARGPAAAKDRSPSDDVVRGTATFRPGLRPGPRWGAHAAHPDPLSVGEGTPLPIPLSPRRLDSHAFGVPPLLFFTV